MFENLKMDSSIKGETDAIGMLFDSGIIELTIKAAFLNIADSGAMALVVHAEDVSGRQFRTSQWMTSGKAKGGKNYYVDRAGNQQYLPGFLLANAITLVTTGKNIPDLVPEEKVIKLYSAKESKEVPTTVQMYTDLIGTKFAACIIKQTVNKQEKVTATDGTVTYVATNDTREENELDKVLQSQTLLTITEMQDNKPAEFAQKWSDKNAGKVKNKVKAVKGAPKAGAPAGIAATPSLFK